MGIVAAGWLTRIPAVERRIAFAATVVLAFVVLGVTVGAAKRPRMGSANDYYDQRVPPELTKLAPSLSAGADAKPRLRHGAPAALTPAHCGLERFEVRGLIQLVDYR